ncbi:putative toxin-antitoxin system toxin component, PIN family [Candidatus Parcubacteria bacterium]|nr:putative toxin-antitoxin system toxin component, PIN family [Candidatus Parcubacteria bacterium]
MRVVIDTNIFVSALFFGGLPQKILSPIEQEKVIPCFSFETFEELYLILNSEKFVELRSALNFTIFDFLEKLKLHSLFFAIPAKPPNIIKENKADNFFLSCALASNAKYIVSGDQHLLTLKSFQKIPILTLREFLNKQS